MDKKFGYYVFGGAAVGAIFGMMSGTILSWLESATYSQPLRGPLDA